MRAYERPSLCRTSRCVTRIAVSRETFFLQNQAPGPRSQPEREFSESPQAMIGFIGGQYDSARERACHVIVVAALMPSLQPTEFFRLIRQNH